MASRSTTSQRILAAARLLVEREGPDALSMRRVADAAGITAMAIYRRFSNRAALLNAVAEQGFEELAANLRHTRLRGSLQTRLHRVADLFLDHALANPKLFELMFLRPREGARRFPDDFRGRRSPTATVSADLIEQGMRSGEIRKGDPWEIVFETGALSQGLLMLYFGNRVDLTQDEFRALYHRALGRYLHGICP